MRSAGRRLEPGYGSANRLTATGNQLSHQDNRGIVDQVEVGDRFGVGFPDLRPLARAKGGVAAPLEVLGTPE
jgi:hypothetical protein